MTPNAIASGVTASLRLENSPVAPAKGLLIEIRAFPNAIKLPDIANPANFTNFAIDPKARKNASNLEPKSEHLRSFESRLLLTLSRQI